MFNTFTKYTFLQVIWLAISTIFPVEILTYKNPKSIYLNEANSATYSGHSHYVEAKRPDCTTDAMMDGYALTVAETKENTKGHLYIKCSFNLNGVIFKSGQNFGVLGRDPYSAQPEDLMTWKPGHTTLRVPSGMLSSYDWLNVQDFQMMVIFLTYHDNQTLFDPDVWPTGKGVRGGKSLLLQGNLLKYIQDNTVDSLIVQGLGAPHMCDDVKKIFCTMFDFEISAMPHQLECNDLESVMTSGDQPLSISRLMLNKK